MFVSSFEWFLDDILLLVYGHCVNIYTLYRGKVRNEVPSEKTHVVQCYDVRYVKFGAHRTANLLKFVFKIKIQDTYRNLLQAMSSFNKENGKNIIFNNTNSDKRDEWLGISIQ